MGTSKDILIDKIYEQKLKTNFYQRKARKFEKGFNIMMEYYDSIADEERTEVNKELKKMSRTIKTEIFNGIGVETHEKLARFLCDKRRLIFLLKNKLFYPVRNLIISQSQSKTPYHKLIVITLSYPSHIVSN